MNVRISKIVLVAITLVAQTSGAATSGTTTAQQGSIVDKLKLSYFSAFSGPAVAKPSASQPDLSGNSADPIFFDNSITLGYKLTDRVTPFVKGRFTYQPVMGHTAKLSNPRVGASIKEFSSGKLSLNGSVDTDIPVTASAMKNKLILAPGTLQTINYELPAGWTLGSYFGGRGYLYGANSEAKVDLALFLDPYVGYQISEKIGAQMTYDLSGTHARGQGLTAFNAEPMSLQPSLNIDIVKQLSVSPFINLFPQGSLLKSAQLGAYLSGSIL